MIRPSRSSSRRGYGAAYRHARAAILGPAGNGSLSIDPPCHWCGAIATTADHEPPMALTGSPHMNLVPACRTCNYGRRPHLDSRPANPSRDW